MSTLHDAAGDEPTVTERMIHDLYLAPASTVPNATEALADAIRSQTDEIAPRAQAQLDRENVEAAAP